MVRLPRLVLIVDELDAVAGGQEVVVRGLARIAAMVEPVGLHVRRELLLHRARVQVQSFENARAAGQGDIAGPDQAVDHEQILRRLMPGARMVGRPQRLAGVGRDGGHRPAAAGKDDHILRNQQARARAHRQRLPSHDRLRIPEWLAAIAVEGYQSLAVMQVHAPAVGRQRHRRHRSLLLPENLAGLDLHRHDVPLLLIPRPTLVGMIGVVPDIGELLTVLGPFRRRAADEQEGDSAGRVAGIPRLRGGKLVPAIRGRDALDTNIVGDDDLVRIGRTRAGAESPARGRIQDRQRRIQSQRHIDLVAHRDQSPRHLGGTALERPLVRIPRRNRPLPQNRAVEGIPGDQIPTGRQLNRGPRALVHDIEQPAVRRDEGAHAGHVIVVPGPARVAQPLIAPRRADHRIMRHRITGRIVEEVRPLVDLSRPRLDRFRPRLALLDVRHAIGRQDAQHLRHRDLARLLGDDQVGEVVDVGQYVARQPVRRDGAIEPPRLDASPRLRHVRCLPVEALDEVALARVQSRRQRAVAAPEVHDEPSRYPSGFEYLRRLPLSGGRLPSRYGDRKRRDDENADSET
jgi:hypothetical protein